MPKLSQILTTIETDAEAFLDEAWNFMKPEIISLGQTVLSQVETAAETYVSSGGNFAEALGSIMTQIPADVVAAEHIVAGYLSTLISKAQASATAATSSGSTGTASAA